MMVNPRIDALVKQCGAVLAREQASAGEILLVSTLLQMGILIETNSAALRALVTEVIKADPLNEDEDDASDCFLTMIATCLQPRVQ